MPYYCYYCGEEIEFFHDGFQAIPVHPSGSCRGRGWGLSSGRGSFGIRRTSEGAVFQFPFITYPSYVNPNARCPVCGAEVYFYQSPYGGRVFFDELGPPWPKHPCTDNPRVRKEFATSEGRSRILNSHRESAEAVPPRRPPAWLIDGWMPFIVSEIINRPVGIEAVGELYSDAKTPARKLRIIQTSYDARYCRQQGEIKLVFSLCQNANLILSALNESPVFLQGTDADGVFRVSSFVLTTEGEIEEITFLIHGEDH